MVRARSRTTWQAHRFTFQKVKAGVRSNGRAACAVRPTGPTIPCDDVLVRSARITLPLDRRGDCGVEFYRGNRPKVDAKTMGSTPQPEGVTSAATLRSAPKQHLGGGARPRRRVVDPPAASLGEDITERPLPEVRNLLCRRRCMPRWSYDNDVSADKRSICSSATVVPEGIPREVGARLYQARAREAPSRSDCDIHTVFTAPLCIHATPASIILPDGLHHPLRSTARSRVAPSV